MSAVSSRPSAPRRPGTRTGLSWWAVALAVVSFGALLAVMTAPSTAHAVSAPQSLAPVLEFLARLVGIAG
ncbi:hypothetical protein OEIGOIKO_06478 [Streptomyces chrestomyceticus JCM 4735]|uniref:Uncharacterized protein n=1 Tax=Streptomyces chrestomyceticus JCM 4735 TaxID=1306181 RepID=A0A7U9PZN7_9ACTN|nr:hypothetical protein [Streptomyces chrestomyceticus]GCD38662.1 hypothetical protein OEIGOIKO_06478 [Streptomyces chrestomyceticus JCM 4735]